MADHLRWQPPLPSLSGKAASRNQQVFIDIFAPGPAPAFLTPLEELAHENYRILTIESRCCTFCTRVFPHPTALRKHLSEGTVQCKKAQSTQRHGGPRFIFFGWKYSQGSIDPAIRKPLMHTKYAKLEELQNLNHPQKDVWLTKVFPTELPSQGSNAASPAISSGSQPRSTGVDEAAPLSPTIIRTPAADRQGSTRDLSSMTPSSATARNFGTNATPNLGPDQPLLVRAESVISSESESGDETPATHYIPSIHLPNWEDGFATIPFHQQQMLPHDMQGYVTPLRRDRNFFKHFLLVELEAIKTANNEYFNTPTSEADQAMRRRWDRPLHISSPASPYINAEFVPPNDTNRSFFDWYAQQVLKSERYPDGSLRPTAENSPSLLSSPWARNADTEPPPPEMVAMFGIGGQLEPQQPILPYTTAYHDPGQLSSILPVTPNSFLAPNDLNGTPGPDFHANPNASAHNPFYHDWSL